MLENPQFSTSGLQMILDQNESFRTELQRVCIASEFVAQSIIKEPAIAVQVFNNRNSDHRDYKGALDNVLSPLIERSFGQAEAELKSLLRQFHRRQFVEILWRDSCAHCDVFETCRQMSDLADASLQASLDLLHHWSASEWGQPMAAGVPQSMIILGMGKLGAHELNVSSDIDLMFTFPESGETQFSSTKPQQREALTNQQFFTRLGQRLIDILDTRTADGFVFRMDMRLRPYGGEGALAISFDAMEDYYQNQGRDWERYAMIKARVVAGDPIQGASLLKRLKPFVYRKYLDFAMFESLRDMKRQINKQAKRGKLHADIKLGPGGIREIEFIIQALQLVHGGRDRHLQQPAIKDAMRELVAGKYLPANIADELQTSYVYLRNLEHKIQALNNEQTQRLPDQENAQIRIAYAMGHESWDKLLTALHEVRGRVAEQFRDVLRTDDDSAEKVQATNDWAPVWKLELSDAEITGMFQTEGFEDASASLKIIQDFRQDRKFLLLSAEGRQRLNAFMPVLLDAVAESEKPSLCLARVMPLIEAVSRRTAYLVLLMENPAALQQLVLYCTVSPLISDYLSKFPVLLDELLSVLDRPPEKSQLADELTMQLLRIEEENFEQQLECLRYFKQAHLLQVAAAEVSGKMPLMKVSDYLTFSAEVILDAVLSLCWQHLVKRHGFPVHSDGSYGELDFAIIGYGKLGGIELSFNSDLDLVFIHCAALDEDTVVTGAQRQINSREFYIKLAQRIMLTLGTYTMSGKLYEVDMRLRPSGASGLLVSSLDSFQEYQQNTAWTWEHQALVRARAVAGNPDLRNKFKTVRELILCKRRAITALANEVIDMREKMRKELSSHSSSEQEKTAFAIKQSRGGIVDIEFLVQFLVLAYAHKHSGLHVYTDNYRILEAAGECGLLAKQDMQALSDAYLELRAYSHQLDLQLNESVLEFPRLAYHQEAVVAIWAKIIACAAQE